MTQLEGSWHSSARIRLRLEILPGVKLPAVNVLGARKPKANRSVLKRRQGLQHLTGPWSTENPIVPANSPVPEDQHALGELCDVMLVSDQHDREPGVVQVLEDFHDLD